MVIGLRVIESIGTSAPSLLAGQKSADADSFGNDLDLDLFEFCWGQGMAGVEGEKILVSQLTDDLSIDAAEIVQIRDVVDLTPAAPSDHQVSQQLRLSTGIGRAPEDD
jgi:hypothetical protein